MHADPRIAVRGFEVKFKVISCCHHVLGVFKYAPKCFVGVLKFSPKFWLNRANLSCTKEFGPQNLRSSVVRSTLECFSSIGLCLQVFPGENAA